MAEHIRQKVKAVVEQGEFYETTQAIVRSQTRVLMTLLSLDIVLSVVDIALR